jgi:Ca2+/H+ antiporter
MSNAFAAVSVLSWAPGIPDLILAVLFAWQNDISAAIDVGLAAALTVTM